jgi:MFS transporter, DHA1 family, inner membrane transport protein
MAAPVARESSPESLGPAAAPPLLILGFACFAANISVRATDPMLPLIAGQFNITLHQAAWLATAYGLPYAGLQLVFGPVADALGKAIVIKICVALLALGFALCALAPGFSSLLAARALSGAVAGGIVPVAFALVGDRVPFAERQVAISRLVIAVITGQMGGAALAGALAQFAGWRSVFAVTAALGSVIAVMAFARLKGTDEPRRHFALATAIGTYADLVRSRKALIVYGTVFCEGLFMFGLFPFVAPTLLERGQGSALAAGLCIASYALGGLIYGLTARHVIRALGPWRMMAGGGILAGMCYIIGAAPVPWLAMAALFAISGFGFYLLHNTMQVLSTELSASARGAAVASFAACYFIGQGLGPVLAGQFSAAFGFSALFAASGVLVALLGIVSSRLMRASSSDGGSGATMR